ncbi:G2/mitotic-specific cyclin [Puccinia graminis f. sp. tritici]|uniref:G2/mitotic-specific cyclin n=1 Tax=Puccinia graminis f. sp. tritici TaxID=56615 RepID=A0A5B0LN29_PUCGR|nr:G2/mitotic-specific cyclin [Puccinia graminis f. sp. tritici]KAA1071129.1 G2/mitotic-specific cyclin [Puccinia graminis f. sp. tritici]
MAPPTRHSSRLGGIAMATAGKEDENAGANLIGRQPAGKVLRGRKDLASTATNASTKAISISKASGVSTTNTRKRILDDRTNNVKTAASVANANAKPTTKAAPLTRKTSNAATKKPMMVLDELKPTEALPKRTIKPIKKEASTRPMTRKASGAEAQSNTNFDEAAGPSGQAKAPAGSKASSGTGALRRNALRLHKATGSTSTDNGLLEPYDAGHVAKKVRTSEPDEILKENCAEQNIIKEKPSKKELTRVAKAQLAKIQQKVAEKDWEDLDEGDEEDPLMVTEYVVEIYNYMKEVEMETLPDSNYMVRQVELTWKMRGVLVDWIIEVHSKFRLLPETLYLAINLMDRFLTKRSVALIKFQLVGVTALFLASKYEEVICPSVTNFLYMTDGGYDCDEILKAETYMLEMLEWDLRYPNPLNFLRRVSKADNYDIQSRTFAKYFMEISIVDYRLVATAPSLLAAASIWLARKLLGRGGWDANLRHYSGYDQPEILPIAQFMLDYILRSGCKNLGMGLDPGFVIQASYEGGNEHNNLFKKYATRKFFRVSEIVRDWAVDRYTFETPTGYEWDKLEEWSSKIAASKKRSNTAGSQRIARQVQEFFANEQLDDDEEEEDEEEDDEGLEVDQADGDDDEIDDDEY